MPVILPGAEGRYARAGQIESGAHSETGPVRPDNQDFVRAPAGEELVMPGFLCAVADGMGGYEHGALAARLAVEALFELFYAPDGAARAPQRALEAGMESANLRVFHAAQRLGAARMGTTLTAAAIRGRRWWVSHAGDSRAYLLRGGRLRCLTDDHTAVGDLVRMKIIAPDKVRAHAQRSILTRAVGLGLFLQADHISLGAQAGDRMVLCSDGLWSALEDAEIEALAARAPSPDALSRSLVEMALRRESDDNASAVSIFVHALEDEPVVNAAPGGWLNRLARGIFSAGRKEAR